MMGQNRIEWLDFIKGIAIIIVVMGHVAQSISGNHPFAELIIIFEMPLFFTLSGILAQKTTQRPISLNLKKKAQSLLVPFFFVGSIYGLATNTLQFVLFDQYHYGYWFLISLFICWLIFLPISMLINKIKLKNGRFVLEFVILFLPFILYKMSRSIIPVKIDEVLTLNFTFTYYRFFIIGYFLGKFKCLQESKHLNIIRGVSTIFVLGYLITFFYKYNYLHVIPMTIQQFIMSTCLIFVIHQINNLTPSAIHNQLKKIGKNSLCIYLFHFFFLSSIKTSIDGSEMIIFLFTLTSAVVVCYLCILVSLPILKNKYLSLIILGKREV